MLEVTITIQAELGNQETLTDLLTILETTVPYIADNVIVTSNTEDGIGMIGVCDGEGCNVTYRTYDGEDHCGEEGTCWEHCKDREAHDRYPHEIMDAVHEALALDNGLAIMAIGRDEAIARDLIARKRLGGDCTAEESAWILSYFDSCDPSDAGQALADAYPLEADQWHDERERGLRAVAP